MAASASVPLFRSTRTSTRCNWRFSATAVTVPTETPLYSSTVLPASTPEPSANSIVISGPWSYRPRTTIQAPIATAMIGTTHTRGRRAAARETLGASQGGHDGTGAAPGGSGVRHRTRGSKTLVASTVRTTAAAKAAMPLRGSTVVSAPNLHQAGEEADQEHVEHRPAPDEIEGEIDPGQAAGVRPGARARRQQQPAQAGQLERGDEHAGQEHDQSDRPKSLAPKFDDAGENRVGAADAGHPGVEDRQHVGRHEHRGRGQRERGGVGRGSRTQRRQEQLHGGEGRERANPEIPAADPNSKLRQASREAKVAAQ